MNVKTVIENLKTLKMFNSKLVNSDETIDEAILALEKQIKKKPVEYEDKFYGCPCCSNPLMHKWEKYNTKLMSKSNGLPYCLNCGQAIDFGDCVDDNKS